MSFRKGRSGHCQSLRTTMQLTPFVPLWFTTYPFAGSNTYVVALSRSCGGTALNAKRISSDSDIRSRFVLDRLWLLVCAKKFVCACVATAKARTIRDDTTFIETSPSFQSERPGTS